ncbi:MAG: DUF3857 domain-containing protein [Myxococcales bacterium]|nr:DUF3857 domain-containing protein [Myxococcales bacterium]
MGRRAHGALVLGALLLLGAAPRDPLLLEAERLAAQAAARGGLAGGAVDLLRLEELADWLPTGWVTAALRKAAADTRRLPLVRATAEWLLRERALTRLDAAAAAEHAARLGLLDAFVVRPGAAPHPTAELTPDGWRPYPRGMGAGVLQLDAVVRPAADTVATVATRLVAAGGPAILRVGYDDEATVWLNGDEVHVAPAPHGHWLDQAAIPVILRPGDNRLVVAVRQQADAWRFSLRVTDAAGVPLPVEAHPDPWGPVPEPAEGEPPAEVDDLWAELGAAVDVEPPEAADRRDFADFARRTGMPDRDQSIPRVAVEGAWETDPSPRSLLAWLLILPTEEQAAVRAAHAPSRPVEQADVHADLRLALEDGYRHFYAGRLAEARATVEALAAASPDFLPAVRLRALAAEELGLPSTAVRALADAYARFPDRPGLQRALVASLRAADRVEEAIALLTRLVASPDGRADDAFQLAGLRAQREETDAAVALLDRVLAARPELTGFALEAADIERSAGREAEATRRLQALLAQIPTDVGATLRLARLLDAAGRRPEAGALLAAARAADPADPELAAAGDRLAATPPEPRLGPPVAELAALTSPADVPAHVLYHHARTEVSPEGLAVRRLRRVVRVQTEEGARRFAEWQLPYVPGTQRLLLEEARLLRPGQPPRSPSRSDRDLSEPAYRLYYDLRAEILDFPPLLPGDIVEVAWRIVDTDPDPAFPGYYGEMAWLQEVAPRAWSVVEVAGAGAAGLKVVVVPRGITVTREGGRVEGRDVPGLPLEADAPGPSSVRAHVHISSLSGWADLDARYQALLAERAQPTERLTELARTWGGEGTPQEILGRLHAAVAHHTRYVGLEFGVRSFRPELPSVTLARGYGDCKDKATLLIALARARGIDARLTLVRTRAAGAIEAEPASFAVFDHAIVYVPALDRFLDPTVDRNDPWTLPPSDQGALAFVVGSSPPVLRRIPPETADQAQSHWRIDGVLDASGAITGEVRWTTRGQPATTARRGLEAEGARQALLEQILGAWFPGAALEPTGFTGLTPAFDPVEVTGRVRLPATGQVAGGVDLPRAGARWQLVARLAQAGARRLPLELEFQEETRLDLALKLPPGHTARAPAPVELASPFGRFTATAAVEGDTLRLAATLRVEVLTVAPADYPAWRAWLASVDAALAQVVEVRR